MSVHMFTHMSTHMSMHMPTHMPTHMSTHISTHMSIHKTTLRPALSEAMSSKLPCPSDVTSGSCLLVPLAINETEGKIIRSVGYAESEFAVSDYKFLEDGTFLLKTQYEQSIAEERIWFVSENVRCRSSVLRTSAGSGILQTSFASEVRRLNIQ